MLRESGLSQLKIPKPVCDMQNRNVGMRTRAPRGMHPASQLGSRAKSSCKKSNRCSRTFQHLPFDHDWEFLAGTLGGFDKVIARIHGTLLATYAHSRSVLRDTSVTIRAATSY